MPYSWESTTKDLEDDLTEAEAQLRRWTMPQKQWEATPSPFEMPKKLWGQAEEKIGEGISKIPILPKVLEPVGKAFGWIHENVEKPFAAIITSPFRPTVAWKKGESYWEHQKREYDEWDAPTYVKGAAEFAMPLWWMPWFGWASRGAKALSTGTKAASALAKGTKGAQAFKLPTGELLDEVLFKGNRLSRAMEKVWVVNRVVKLIGGEAAFAHPTSQAPLQITRRELVKMGKIYDMRNGVKRLHVPKLQVMGRVEDVLRMDSKGVVNNIVDKTGKSQYLYDVLEGAMKNPENYTFVTKEAKQYVETLGKILDDVYKLAREEGVKAPKERFLHRIVKGKTNPDTLKYEASEYGSLFEKTRHYSSQKFGVEGVSGSKTMRGGVDYGLSVNESISSTIDHYVRGIARHRFEKEIGKLGKTAKQMFADAFPEEAENIIKLGSVIASGKYAGQALSRLSSYAGGRIPASVLTKIRRELPEIGIKIDRALLLSPGEATEIITKLSNELKSTLKLAPNEVNSTLRQIEYIARAFRDEKSIGKIMYGDVDDAVRYISNKAGGRVDIIEKVYKEAYNMKRKAVRDAVKSVKEDIKGLVENTKTTLSPLGKLRREELRRLGGKQIIGENMAKFNRHPAFKDSIFPKEVVKTTERLIQDTGQDWLRTMANISGTSRMLTAAMDLSAPFIQGAPVFGGNPLAWGKAVKNMMEFAIKPDNFYKYLTDPKVMATATERIAYGGSAATFEFFEALAPLQRAIGKLPGGKKFGEKVVGQTYGRAETAFTGFGEVARNEMWRALKRPGMADNELMDLARTIDRMTGVMSTEALAIGKTQMDFENAFVFFAPRYTRAGLAMVGDILKRGATGAEARKAIAGLAGGGFAMYYGICKALGQEVNLNPNSGRFMTIKVGDSHIGVGGIMTALIRLSYDIGITAAEDPINLVKPLSEGKLNRWDNPFIRFMYARTAPMTSTLYSSLVEQANYFGEPFEDIGDWGKFMADKVTPIAAQETTEALYERARGRGEELPYPTAIGAEFAGLRVFPKSPWELMDEERDKFSMRNYGQPYENLNDLQQTEIDRNDTVIRLQKDVDVQTVTRGDKESIGFINRERERESARQDYEDNLNNFQQAYDAGAITGYDFRERMSDEGYGLGKTYEHIDKQPEYKEVLETLKKPRKIKDKHLADIAYSEFMDTLYETDKQGNSIFEDQYGLFQYDKYNAYIEQFKTKYGNEVYRYVLDIKEERDRNLPQLAKEYQIAKEVMKPYWAVQSRVEAMFGKRFAESSRGQSFITKMRKNIRLQNPEIDRLYNLFYVRT